MKSLARLTRVLGYALRRPRTAWLGAREFRSDLTPHFEDYDALESYDAGRELAHLLTLRRYDSSR